MPMISTDNRVALSSIGESRLNSLNSSHGKKRSFYDSVPLHPSKKHKQIKRPSNKSFDNEIDEYASKLRSKLKLAIYKLNQQNIRKGVNLSFNSPTTSSTKLITQPSRIAESPLNRKIRLKPTASFKKSFSNSANLNLNRKPSLASIINKHKSNSNLKLFTIKKDSPFFHPHINNVPLKPQQTTSSNSMALPPINKILKTPLKLTNSTRNLIDHSDSTIISHELSTDDTLEDDPSICKKSILTSSPIKNSFATPNSFSVAKSLLQLGSGFYS